MPVSKATPFHHRCSSFIAAAAAAVRFASSGPGDLNPADPLPPPFLVTTSAKRLIAFELDQGAGTL
eukprot:1173518-Pleurochrysis_carterae.AAC.1